MPELMFYMVFLYNGLDGWGLYPTSVESDIRNIYVGCGEIHFKRGVIKTLPNKNQRTHKEILQDIKTCFPSPVSNPVMDGYLIHTISHFLDHIDSLKCDAPVLGMQQESCNECILHTVDRERLPMRPHVIGQSENDNMRNFPDGMSQLEKVTELLADYCRGMTIWAHPNAQINVIPPPSIPIITAFIVAAIYNPNLVWDEYSGVPRSTRKKV